MSKLVPLSGLARFRNRRYSWYREVSGWKNDDRTDILEHTSIYTSNCLLRPSSVTGDRTLKNFWELPEIHNADDVAEHAWLTNSILHELGVDGALAQLRMSKWPWFGGKRENSLNHSRILYFKSIAAKAPYKPTAFRGGISLDCPPTRFVNLYLDYAFLNMLATEVEILCNEVPLLLQFTHHLGVVFVSPDPAVMRIIKRRLSKSWLQPVPENSRVYTRPEVKDRWYA